MSIRRSRDERRDGSPSHLGMLRSGLRVRWRLHAVFLAAAVLVVATATIGGVFAAAADEAIARDAIAAAAPGDAEVHLDAHISSDDPTFPPNLLDEVLREAPKAGRYSFFPERVPVLSLAATAEVAALSGRQRTRLVWREGFCAHLHVVAGRCPTRADEVMVSQATIAYGGAWRLGATVRTYADRNLTIVGVYRPRSTADPFWGGDSYFDGGALVTVGNDTVTSIDTLFVSLPTFEERLGDVGVRIRVDYPVEPGRNRIAGGAGLLAQVDAMRAAVRGTHLTVRTAVPAVLRAADGQRRAVAQGAGLAALQLVLLGAVVLYFLTLEMTEGRRQEIALAKLRGQGPLAVARFALGEPLVVLLVALPLGILAGYLGGLLLSELVLRPEAPVLLPPSALLGAALAVTGAALAAAASTRRVLTRPILEQWASAPPSHGNRAVRALAVAAVLGVVAAAVLLPLLAGRGAAVLGLEPALTVLATALIGIPLLRLLAQALAPRSRASSHLARFLAVRRLARGRAARRTALLLVATLGLAAFAVSGQSVLSSNRSARASAEIGAARVLQVGVGDAVDPVSAVDEVDPDGRWAMAAAEWLPDGGESVAGSVVAIDPERLAAVASPVADGLPAPQLAAAVDARVKPAITFRGDRLLLTLRGEALRGGAPEVLPEVRTATGELLRIDAGPLRPGVHRYAVAVTCSRGCTFVDLVWAHPVTADGLVSGRVTLQELAAERGGARVDLAARLDDAAAWRPGVPVSESTDRVRVTSDGVIDDFRTTSGEASLSYAAFRATLPAVVGRAGLASPRPPGGWSVSTSTGDSLPFSPVRTTGLLPRVLDGGVALDVRALDQNLTGFAQSARWEVWLSPSAPADAPQRLERAGLDLGSSSTRAGREAELAREGPALSFTLLLALALVAAVLAVLATAVSTSAAVRARAAEAAAMRLIGVPARAVVRAAVLEQTLLLLASAVIAIPAGVLAVVVVLPLLPQSATPTPVPLLLLPRPAPVVWFGVVYAAAVALVSGAAAAALTRAAGPARLREVDG